MTAPNRFLIAAALLSAIAALLHLGIIVLGAPGYRFFGAGERMAKLAESGHWYPAAVTSCIALVLGIWALYALSGAGVIRLLPWVKPALCLITAIYLLRGLGFIPVTLSMHVPVTPFALWSSAICVVYGLVHLVGLTQVWSRLE